MKAWIFDILDLSGITPVDELYWKESIIFMKKYTEGKQPKAFNEIIGEAKDDNMRSSREIVYIINNKLRKNDCFYEIISAWNKCSNDLKEAKNFTKTKYLIKEKTIEAQSNIKCTTRNCFSCKKDAGKDFRAYMAKQ